jgi:hypothetical protein
VATITSRIAASPAESPNRDPLDKNPDKKFSDRSGLLEEASGVSTKRL